MSQNPIQTELNSLIANFAKNSVQSPQATDPFTPVLDDKGNPLPEKVETTATETVKVEPAKVEQKIEPVTPVIVKEGLFEDWDKVSVEPTTVTETKATETQPPVQFDYSVFAKALGKDSISGAEDVVKEISVLKTSVDAIQSAPEELVNALAIARLGGDYLEYLKVSQIDWESEDPIVLYENYVEDQFYDPKTKLINYEEAEKILEKLDDSEKKFRGLELQRQYIARQSQEKSVLEQAAKAKKAHFETSVRDVVNSLTDVNGFVLTPAKKAELLNYVLSGEDVKESDVKTRVVNAFIKKNFQSIDSYMKTKIKNTTTRDILKEAQMPDLKPTGEKVDVQPTKQYSINDWIQDLKTKKGF